MADWQTYPGRTIHKDGSVTESRESKNITRNRSYERPDHWTAEDLKHWKEGTVRKD